MLCVCERTLDYMIKSVKVVVSPASVKFSEGIIRKEKVRGVTSVNEERTE